MAASSRHVLTDSPARKKSGRARRVKKSVGMIKKHCSTQRTQAFEEQICTLFTAGHENTKCRAYYASQLHKK
jgi:hypothetical protein